MPSHHRRQHLPIHTRRFSNGEGPRVACLHGLLQHGGVFEDLASRLVPVSANVAAFDLRGHGKSVGEPPWNLDTHVLDVCEALRAHDLSGGTLIGHSFGGRVAAAVVDRDPSAASRLVLLDPGLDVSPERAFRSAEIDRLDWSFASPEGAVRALLSTELGVATPPSTARAFVEGDLEQGLDHRWRFSVVRSAAVVAWSEMTLPPPPIADVATMIVRPQRSVLSNRSIDRYRETLGDRLTVVEVPNGHNVLWEAPRETAEAILRFMDDSDTC